ncbi:d-amino acid oxidase [Moniliophthora roreri]|nr:d-amino acid oxidase [Moniliophthora roreri]
MDTSGGRSRMHLFFIFIVTHNDEIFYVGGFSKPDNYDFDFDETDPKVRMIAKNAKE